VQRQTKVIVAQSDTDHCSTNPRTAHRPAAAADAGHAEKPPPGPHPNDGGYIPGNTRASPALFEMPNPLWIDTAKNRYLAFFRQVSLAQWISAPDF
jgi:hypothetical protein